MEGPSHFGEHLVILPELSDPGKTVNVDKGRVVGIIGINPQLAPQVSLFDLPRGLLIRERCRYLSLHLLLIRSSSHYFPIS